MLMLELITAAQMMRNPAKAGNKPYTPNKATVTTRAATAAINSGDLATPQPPKSLLGRVAAVIRTVGNAFSALASKIFQIWNSFRGTTAPLPADPADAPAARSLPANTTPISRDISELFKQGPQDLKITENLIEFNWTNICSESEEAVRDRIAQDMPRGFRVMIDQKKYKATNVETGRARAEEIFKDLKSVAGLEDLHANMLMSIMQQAIVTDVKNALTPLLTPLLIPFLDSWPQLNLVEEHPPILLTLDTEKKTLSFNTIFNVANPPTGRRGEKLVLCTIRSQTTINWDFTSQQRGHGTIKRGHGTIKRGHGTITYSVEPSTVIEPSTI